MSFIGPSGPSKAKGQGGPNKGGYRRHENNRLYAHPLPLVFSDPSSSRLRSVLGLLGLSQSQIINPHCSAYLDSSTRSVWVVNAADATILWRRGFFGKGNLSRSEPSWFVRRLNDRKGGGTKLTSEELREARRSDRRQFKLDRAAAIAAVAAEAEKIFESEGRVIVPALSGPAIPSGATWKRAETTKEEGTGSETQTMGKETQGEEEEEPLEDMEHLQLTLVEAFFLAWNLDCLTILDSDTDEPLSLQDIWTTFQSLHLSPIPYLPSLSPLPSPSQLQFDNPFLIHYAAYHHYRSLGWVIKNGLKFCVDYLLYKRGPVFTHAEFAVVICPVYEDPADQEASTTNLQNATPFSWSWLSTVNRVNSQVMKTLILTYVTIPARSRLSTDVLASPACFAHYSVREVIVRRFIPARMRD